VRAGTEIAALSQHPAQQGRVFPAGTTSTRTELACHLVNADNPVPGLLLAVACYWTSSSDEPGVPSVGICVRAIPVSYCAGFCVGGLTKMGAGGVSVGSGWTHLGPGGAGAGPPVDRARVAFVGFGYL